MGNSTMANHLNPIILGWKKELNRERERQIEWITWGRGHPTPHSDRPACHHEVISLYNYK